MTERLDSSRPSPGPVGTATGCSQSLKTHWQRFFRTTPETDMDSFDTTVDASRGDTSREWEVFYRESESEPLTHVGSVSAPTVAVAREQAATLFGHAAAALWLCPADETVRLQASALGVGEGEQTAGPAADGCDDTPTMDADRMDAETLRGEAE